MTETTFRLNPNPDGMTPSEFMQSDSFTTNDRTEMNVFYSLILAGQKGKLITSASGS